MKLKAYLFWGVLLVGFCSVHADVPELAKIKAAAEAGNPEAQFRFAQSFGPGGSDWNRWMEAAAAQGYGPAEDELAWVLNWAEFATNYSDPKTRAYHLKSNGAKMLKALVLASSAADKGFGRSRLILGWAYAHGYQVPQDRVESYMWMKLAGKVDILGAVSSGMLKDELLKTMSLDEVKRGEALAANFQPGATVVRIRNAIVVPKIKLAGITASGDERIALVNGTRVAINQTVQLKIEGLIVPVRCVGLTENSVDLELLPQGGRVTLVPGKAPMVTK